MVYKSDYNWQDGEWMQAHRGNSDMDVPISIYEVHLGSWRRGEDGSMLGYREIAVHSMGPFSRLFGFRTTYRMTKALSRGRT